MRCEVCHTPGAIYLRPSSTVQGWHEWKCVDGCRNKFLSEATKEEE